MHMCRSTNLGLCSHTNETLTSFVISASLVNDFVGHQSTSGLHMPMQFNNKTLFEAPCIWCIYNCRNCFRITSFLNFWSSLENHVDYKVFEVTWERSVWKPNEYFDSVMPSNGWYESTLQFWKSEVTAPFGAWVCYTFLLTWRI